MLYCDRFRYRRASGSTDDDGRPRQYGVDHRAVVESVAGANPVSVVGAVALALVAWETGEHAVGLGAQLGRSADTATVEYVRATGLLTVGAVATLGCAALAYLGPPLPVGADRALVALTLLLVALTARLGFATE